MKEKEKILKAIIRLYLETGDWPVSRTISKYTDLNCLLVQSRNECPIWKRWVILQPHLGRIPSDKSYRLYVDELMREKKNRKLQTSKTWSLKKQTEWKSSETGCQSPRFIYQLCNVDYRTGISQKVK